ncbi:MAG: ATP-binding protein [Thermoplasmata archaeon]
MGRELTKPGDVFDREGEWAELARFALSPGRGLRLGLMYGRRRQGKSFLLRRLAARTGGFYHQALEEERRPALDRLGAALAAHLALPVGGVRFADWAEAATALARLGAKGKPRVVVLDEFPYLLAHSPELPSALQRAVDGSRAASGPAVRLVLCGSALCVMSGLLAGAQALRGRASLEIVLRPFDFRQTAEFWGIGDPELAFQVHAIVGGTPGYQDLLDARPPRSVRDLGRWLAEGVLNPASAVFREDDYLLGEERTAAGRGVYHSVLGAIAGGATAEGRIAAALGRDQRGVQHALRVLERAGFVIREEDVLRRRRPVYRLADPIVRFHQAVTRLDLSRFEERRTEEAWADAAPRYLSGVLGPHFENLAREFVRRYASAKTLGGRVGIVGPAVISDPAGRTRHQIDVVALRSEGGRRPGVRVLGEAKYSTRPMGLADLGRLQRIRDLLDGRGFDVSEAKLALFSARGFQKGITAALPGECELVDFDRLYSGD